MSTLRLDTVSRLDALYVLALCVWKEARSEDALGKRLVAETVMNRVNDPRWPNNVRGVVLQPKQFSAFNEDDPNRTLQPEYSTGRDYDAWQESLRTADETLSAAARLVPYNHYHTVNVSPNWSHGKKPLLTHGKHVFYAW